MGRPQSRRWTSTCAVAAALLYLTLGAALPAQAEDARTGFAGTIKDSVGHVLDGVEILIVRGASAADPVAQLAPIAHAASDAWGRFTIPDLTPGTYSLAALKTGYRTYIGNVDTRVERVIDVVLFPMPARGSLPPGTLPEDAAWLLRLPRRSVFRETDAGVDTASGQEDENGNITVPSLGVPIQMRVDQLFAVGAPFPSQRGEPVKLQGNETRVRLATSLGERGNLTLDGRRESLGSSLETDRDASASSESAGLRVDFSYDISPDSRLAMKAFFNEQDLAWSAAEALPFGSRRQSWGYKSEWQKQLGDQSSLRLGVDYNDDSFRLPQPSGGSQAFGTFADPGVDVALARRTVVAGGAYESMAADRHQLQVAFKARLFESPDLSSGADAELATLLSGGGRDLGRDNDGWSLRLNAQDSWAMTGPFTLLYGLDYQHALNDRDTAVFVPSMGGAWAIDRVAMRFMVSYHAVAQWQEAPADSKYDLRLASLLRSRSRGSGRDDLLPARDVGYQAEVELPVTATLRLKGASSFVPIQLEGIGGPLHATDPVDQRESGSFLSDGTAAVGETSLSLVHDIGDARTWFELSRGQAQGMLAMGSDPHGVLPTLTLGELTYDNGSWGFQMIPSGTDLRVQYKRVVESQGHERDGRQISERETVELQLIQSLMRFQGLGNWRLLMAVRMAMQDSEDDDRWASGTDPAVLRAFNEGVSAGLSVTF